VGLHLHIKENLYFCPYHSYDMCTLEEKDESGVVEVVSIIINTIK
jgi:hypothetical protein